MDDLGQLIFVVLFILFGLISSSKKKAQPKPRARGVTRPPPNPPRVQEDASTEVALPLAPEAPGNAEKIVRPKRELAEELLAFLQGQAEPASEPVVVLPEFDDEAESVETLEPAGEESSHERFRDKYVDVVPQQRPYAVEEIQAPRPYAITDTPVERPYLVEDETTPQPYAFHDRSKERRRLTRSELRHAFVMKEVLGPPKALEE